MSGLLARLLPRRFAPRRQEKAQAMTEAGPLKLRARDREDYAVVSAVLQDALVAVRDMTWLTGEKRFVMVTNRFRWERRVPAGDLPDQPAEPGPAHGEDDARFEDAPLYERVHCGVTFDRVEGVHYRGFSKQAGARILELLAVVADETGLTVTFAGDAALRLQGRHVVCHLEDLGDPWPTHWRPSHTRTDTAGEAGGDGAGAQGRIADGAAEASGARAPGDDNEQDRNPS